MLAVRSYVKAIHFVPILALMMCAYGPCSPTSCPREATVGPEQGCWFEFTPEQPTVSVNAGELQVGLNQNSQLQKAPRYRFAFIQDPQDRVLRKDGRIGTWKLNIKTWLKQQNQRLQVAWTLREGRPYLQKHETLRLALSWIQHGQRKFRILPGRYNTKNNRLHAVLSAEKLHQPQTYLFPVRYHTVKKTKSYQASQKHPMSSKLINVATASK